MEVGLRRNSLLGLLLLVGATLSEDIEFDSGRTFRTVNASTDTTDLSPYDDPKNTGSYLFNAAVDDIDRKLLSLAVPVNSFRSQSSTYFRAHPVFVSCLQAVLNKLLNDETPAVLLHGYLTAADVGGSTSEADLYARSGCGARIFFPPGVNGVDQLDIVAAIMISCPVIFERIQRDVGIVVETDSVHVHMTGLDDPSRYLRDERTAPIPQFETWAQGALNAGLDPPQSPNCSLIMGLESGETYPSGVTTPQEVVGEVDQPVTRDTLEDYKRLVQFQGTNVVFDNPERSAAWCGKPGLPCVDCSSQPAGNSLGRRCASRLMSSRMYNFLRVLQKMVRDALPGNKLRVLKAYDEAYDGNAAYDSSSLHVEGRQLILQLTPDNNVANLKTVTKLARCIGVDYVEHNGNDVVLAVKKMKGRVAQLVEFQEATLLAVQPPAEFSSIYRLPAEFPESEEDEYPLIDTNAQMDEEIAEYTTLGQFVSTNSSDRYMRLHPLIALCYSQVYHQLNKHNQDGDAATDVDVVRAFISTDTQQASLDMSDKRFNTFILGVGMEVRFGASNPHNHSLAYLLQTVLDKCSPLFTEEDQEIGLGLYTDRVFVDLREEYELWVADVSLLPPDYASEALYSSELYHRYIAAVENRIVDPDDLEEARNMANRPEPQHPDYRHTPSPRVQRRRRRQTPDPDDCVPQTDTAFCTATKKFRDLEIDHVWADLLRKHFYHDKPEVLTVLQNCLGLCGTCLEGSVFEAKQENCDNLIHWVPFRPMNDEAISNFFPRDKRFLARYASLEHSVEDSEVYLLLINSVLANWRPDPSKSVEHELYPQSENPSPLLSLLQRLYAIHASGKVKVWVQDDNDLSSLRDALEVLLLYNRNVTSMDVYVADPSSKDSVEASLETLKDELTSVGYPPLTRQFITKYAVHDLPKFVAKRDVNTALREGLIDHYTNWETRWINRDL